MTYVVQAGDTLAALGRRFGLSEAALAAANGLVNPNRLSVGQTLVIVPAPTSQEPSVNTISPAGAAGSGTSTTTIYTVRAGDTLVALATRFNMTPSAIAAANGLVNPNLIIVGQPLVIAPLPEPRTPASTYHQQWPQAGIASGGLEQRFPISYRYTVRTGDSLPRLLDASVWP